MTTRARTKAVHREQRQRKTRRKAFHPKSSTRLFIDPNLNMSGSIAALAAVSAANKKG